MKLFRTDSNLIFAGVLLAAGMAVVFYSARRVPENCHLKTQSGFPSNLSHPILERFECNRCHIAPGVLEPVRETKACVGCHQEILNGEFDRSYEAESVSKWKRNIKDFVWAPSLQGLQKRIRREWFEQFIREPYKVRPDLHSMMPRLNMSIDEARAIADIFYSGQSATPANSTDSKLELNGSVRGAEIFSRKNCTSCHKFSGAHGVPPSAIPSDSLREFAPDLRYVRDRMARESAAAWLRDPKSIEPGAKMPKQNLSAEEIADLVSFLYDSEVMPPVKIPARDPLPLLSRPVAYPEVEKQVFKRICWHCHSDPVPVGGDGGPGNTGGFGYRGKGIDLSSYESIMAGGINGDGSQFSLLEVNETNIPKIIRHMIARQREVEGSVYPSTLGMPLGLPPLSPEEIQLVWTWIAQGAPR